MSDHIIYNVASLQGTQAGNATHHSAQLQH